MALSRSQAWPRGSGQLKARTVVGPSCGHGAERPRPGEPSPSSTPRSHLPVRVRGFGEDSQPLKSADSLPPGLAPLSCPTFSFSLGAPRTTRVRLPETHGAPLLVLPIVRQPWDCAHHYPPLRAHSPLSLSRVPKVPRSKPASLPGTPPLPAQIKSERICKQLLDCPF